MSATETLKHRNYRNQDIRRTSYSNSDARRAADMFRSYQRSGKAWQLEAAAHRYRYAVQWATLAVCRDGEGCPEGDKWAEFIIRFCS